VDDRSRLRALWVEVKPPDYVPVDPQGTEQIELELPKTPTIQYNDMEDRYQWDGLGGFSEPGTYQVFYFAKDDTTENVSPIMASRVYKALSGNRPPDPFSLIVPENGSEAFSEVILLDWEDAVDPDGDQLTYTVLLSEGDDSFSDPIRKEGLAHSTGVVSRIEDGVLDGSLYYWKVQAIDEYGAIRETDVRAFMTNFLNLWPGWVSGHVSDLTTRDPITNATVSVGSLTFNTALEGYYLQVVPPGTYPITVTASGYEQAQYSGVIIAEGNVVSKNVEMSASQRVAMPIFSPLPGMHTSGRAVEISCETEGATIHYTLDGNNPTTNSPEYDSPIEVSETTTIRAKAFKTDWAPSEIATGDYVINIVKGDINGDGKVDLADAISIMKMFAGMDPSSTLYRQADLNRDNKIGLEEVIYVLQKLGGLRN
jgi:hypothetical protein